MFAQRICYVAIHEWDLEIESLSESRLEQMADEALLRFPEECDARFRKMAMGRILVFHRRCLRVSLTRWENVTFGTTRNRCTKSSDLDDFGIFCFIRLIFDPASF